MENIIAYCPITHCSNRVNELWRSTKDLQSEGFHASDVPALFRHIVWQEHFNSCALNAPNCIGAQKQQAICADESAWGPSLFSSLHSWLIHYECGELCISASPKHEHVMRTVFTFTPLISEVFVGGLEGFLLKGKEMRNVEILLLLSSELFLLVQYGNQTEVLFAF